MAFLNSLNIHKHNFDLSSLTFVKNMLPSYLLCDIKLPRFVFLSSFQSRRPIAKFFSIICTKRREIALDFKELPISLLSNFNIYQAD